MSSHEVWARIVWAAVDMAEKGGLDMAAIYEGLPFNAVTLRRRTRVRWDDYCTIVERIASACGGPTELEDLLESTYHTVLPELRILAGAVVSPMQYVRFVWDVIDPLLLAPLQFSLEELGPDRVRLSATCRPGVRGCLELQQGSIGAIRGMTRILGLPPARIDRAEVSPTELICEVTLPTAPGWSERGRRAGNVVRRLFFRAVLGASSDGTILAADIGEPEASHVAHAIDVLQLTPRQGEVLAHVAEGLTNKEIAYKLGTAENTIELHVGRILRKARATSRSQLVARLWSRSWGFPQ